MSRLTEAEYVEQLAGDLRLLFSAFPGMTNVSIFAYPNGTGRIEIDAPNEVTHYDLKNFRPKIEQRWAKVV